MAAPAQFSWSGGQSGARYGSALTFLGDLNGDGSDAIAIGSPLYLGPNGVSGRVEVRERDSGVVYTIDGQWFGDQFGGALARIPDVDGDLIPELVVGAWGSNQGGLTAGKVYVFSGSSGSLIWSRVGFPGERLGFSVAHAGDTHGTGLPSIIVGAPGANGDTGAAYVLAGPDGTLLASWSGENPGDHFGHAVSGAGLIGGDARDDVLVSAPWAANGNGKVRIFSPWTGGLQANVNYNSSALFGFSVAGFDDVTGDGRNDFIVGLPSNQVAGQPTGAVTLRETLSWSNSLASWTGSQTNEAFGSVVAKVGDFDGDSAAELACAAPTWDGPLGPDQGQVVINKPQGTTLLSVAGIAVGEQFGAAVAGQGDFNGDGLADILVGAPRHSTATALFAGRVALFLAPGIATYGTGLGGLNTLTLDGFGGTGANDLLTISAGNGTPGTIGSLWVSLHPENLVVPVPGGSMTLLISLDSLWPEMPFPFDANGSFSQTWHLQPAVIAPVGGMTIYSQASSGNLATGLVAASNGLAVTFEQ